MAVQIDLLTGRETVELTGRPGTLLRARKRDDVSGGSELILFATDGGRVLVLSSEDGIPAALDGVGEPAPYSSGDRLLSIGLVATWLGEGHRAAVVGRSISAMAKLLDAADGDLLIRFDAAHGRPPTLTEYGFLRQGNRRYRLQAAAAFPVLLPWLNAASRYPEMPPGSAAEILRAIDAGTRLAPVLAREFQCSPAVIRRFQAVRLPRPTSFAEALGAAAMDPVQIAAALDRLPADKRPDRGDMDAFLLCLRWAEEALQAAAAPKDFPRVRPFVPHIAARAWLAVRRRQPAGRVLPPDMPDGSWLVQLQAAVALVGDSGGAALWSGGPENQTAILPASLWVLVDTLSKYHPEDIVREGLRWRARAGDLVRRGLHNAFFPAVELPTIDVEGAPSADPWSIKAIPSVQALLKSAARARNCVAEYLAEIFRRQVLILELYDRGVFAGHVELCQTAHGIELGQTRFLRNRPLPADGETFCAHFAPEMARGASLGAISPTDATLAARAARTIDQAQVAGNYDYAAAAWVAAKRRFGLVRVETPPGQPAPETTA